MEDSMMGSDAGSVADVSHGSDSEATAPAQAVPDYKGTKHKVKVDGQEAEIDYDQLVSDYQTKQAAHKRWREANELSAKQKAREDAWKKDPQAALKELGHDPEKWAEDLLIKKLQWEGMSEEAQEAILARQEAAELKKKLADLEAGEQQAAVQAAQAEALQEIDTDIAEALQAAGRKPTPRLVARLAETMLAHLEGGKQVKASEVFGSVREEYQADLQEYFATMSVDEARQVLPKNLLDGLRRASVEKALSSAPIPGTRKDRQQPTPRQDTRATTTDEFFKKLEQKWSA